MGKARLGLKMIWCLGLLAAVGVGWAKTDGQPPVKLAYFGSFYEAPLWVADSRGFFQTEGVKVQLVKSDFNNLPKQIASGQVDGVTADSRIFTLIARGMRLKLIGGLHSNCVRIIVPVHSALRGVRDLKGKTIGVVQTGDGPMVVAARLFRNNGFKLRSLTWKVIAEPEINRALTAGSIDAAVVWEPARLEAPTVAPNYKVIFSTAKNQALFHAHNGFQHFYGSFIGLSERLIREQPQAATAVSRAWLQGARWVGAHSAAAAGIVGQQQGEQVNRQAITSAIANVMWMPGVRLARENIRFYIQEQQKLAILPLKKDANWFFSRVYAPIIPDLNAR